MKRLLIVEDQSADLRVAVDVVKSLGVSFVEARTSTTAAKAIPGKCAEEKDCSLYPI